MVARNVADGEETLCQTLDQLPINVTALVGTGVTRQQKKRRSVAVHRWHAVVGQRASLSMVLGPELGTDVGDDAVKHREDSHAGS